MGVTSVKVRKDNKAIKCDITKTDAFREAMDDVKKGRIYQAESVDDMFKQILVWIMYNLGKSRRLLNYGLF